MKDIKGYEGLYAITSCGKVWSHRAQKFLKPQKDRYGYLHVNLYKDGKAKKYKIHRLVAEAYIPNPENKPQVNHKDENKEHNYVNNLEWMTSKENNNYGNHDTRKSVYCVELDKVFSSTTEAARQLGIFQSNISACCHGERKTCGGYTWRYIQ